MKPTKGTRQITITGGDTLPENNLKGYKGDLYVYAPKSGTPALYQKQVGKFSKTGWVNVSSGGGGVQSVNSGTGINVDNTDPENPIVNATGIQSVVAGDNVTVDDTDPLNPVVNATGATPGGFNHSIQYFDANNNTFGGDNDFQWNNDSKTLDVVGGQYHGQRNARYDINTSANTNDYHVVFTGGTGTPTLNLASSGTITNRFTIVVSDGDGIASTSNITIDAGTGNTIQSIAGNAQTLVLSSDGESAMLMKISPTKWVRIS